VPTKRKAAARKPASPAKPTKTVKRKASPAPPPARDVDSVVAALQRLATKQTKDGMARYGLPSDNAFGVPVSKIQQVGKELRKELDADARHRLAAALWETGWYEARMLTSFVDEPALVTPAQMDRWCRDFDNWGICDTVCFHLFDRTPHAYRKVVQWAGRKPEFERRAGFALMASLAGHDKAAGDERFLPLMPLIERAAGDDRNFVKKAVSWALRRTGMRSPALRAAAVAMAQRLAESDEPSRRWVGKDALRDLEKPSRPRKAAR
jgi:3-methyladenine DNA glycosylase AlkD